MATQKQVIGLLGALAAAGVAYGLKQGIWYGVRESGALDVEVEFQVPTPGTIVAQCWMLRENYVSWVAGLGLSPDEQASLLAWRRDRFGRACDASRRARASCARSADEGQCVEAAAKAYYSELARAPGVRSPGEFLWSATLPGDVVSATPLESGGAVVLYDKSDARGTMTYLRGFAANGTVAWSADQWLVSDGIVMGPAHDCVVAIAEDAVIGLDPGSGRELWRRTTPGRAREVMTSGRFALITTDGGGLQLSVGGDAGMQASTHRFSRSSSEGGQILAAMDSDHVALAGGRDLWVLGRRGEILAKTTLGAEVENVVASGSDIFVVLEGDVVAALRFEGRRLIERARAAIGVDAQLIPVAYGSRVVSPLALGIWQWNGTSAPTAVPSFIVFGRGAFDERGIYWTVCEGSLNAALCGIDAAQVRYFVDLPPDISLSKNPVVTVGPRSVMVADGAQVVVVDVAAPPAQ